jgi:hypothetical protein
LEDSTVEENQNEGDQFLSESGGSTPTAAPTIDPNWESTPNSSQLPQLSSTNLSRTTVHDVAVEVVIAPARGAGDRGTKSDRHALLRNAMSANMIVSVWNLEDVQYYTLTFTSTGQTGGTAATRTSSRVVKRTTLLHNSQSSASSSSSSKRSATSSSPASKVVTPTFQHPEFPPRGPPLRSNHDLSSSASIFQKASQLKDALLNCINMPAYGLLPSRFVLHAFWANQGCSNVERSEFWYPK